MLTFATLGPAGSNHQLVTRRYLDRHRLTTAEIELVDEFSDAFERMAAGEIQHIVQAAVHPQATDCVARAHFDYGIHVIDTFISPSRELVVLTRTEVDAPQSLALQPATQGYLDTGRWPSLVPEASIMTVAAGLIAGRYDSGVTARDVADAHPGRFRVDQVIGTVDDPWIVYGRQRVCRDGAIIWPDSPAARFYRA